jgi:hypothetical protein
MILDGPLLLVEEEAAAFSEVLLFEIHLVPNPNKPE